MIIFGSTTINSTMAEGEFHCPRCSCNQGYRHRKANGFFTLYFIPLIPIGSRGTFIECNSCGGTYAEQVLDFDPAQAELETNTSVFRMLISFMIAFNKVDGDSMFACQRACSQLLGYDITQDIIESEIRMAQSATVGKLEFVKREASDYNLEGKILILNAAKQIAEGRTGLDHMGRESLKEMAQALAIDRRSIDQVLAALENPA